MSNKKEEKKVKEVVTKAEKVKEKGKKNRGTSKLITYILAKKAIIISFICGVAITGIICGIMWPERIAKLSDGSDVVASVNGTTVSADSLYKELAGRGGLSTVLEMLDIEILKSKYNLDEEARSYAEEQSASYYEQWESIYGFTKEEFLSNNGFNTEEAFMDYLVFEFYKNKYFDDYLNSKIKDEEVRTYYDDVIKDTRHTYVFYTAEDDTTDLTKIKKALAKGTSIEKVKNKYSNIQYSELGNIDYNSYNVYTEKFLSELSKLGKKEVSSVFKDDNFGNVVIYVSEVKEKEAFDDIKDQIRSNLTQNLYNNDENVYYRAFQELRAEYNLVIEDANIKAEYETFVENTKEK